MKISHLFEEGRVDFLRAKYIPLIDKLYHDAMQRAHGGDAPWRERQKFNELNNLVDDIVGYEDQDEHDVDNENAGKSKSEILFEWMLKLDPSPKKIYTQWILNLFLQDRFNAEDAYKVEEYLRMLDAYKPQMAPEARDINKYKDMRELYRAVMPYAHAESKREVDRKLAYKAAAESKIVYDDPEYKVLIPKTKEASCYFGRNTQWCTAAKNSWNAFNTYNDQGPLYVVLDKKNNKRWQFHWESGQFMDEHDEPIETEGFIKDHPKIAALFFKIRLGGMSAMLPNITFDGFPVLQGTLVNNRKSYSVPSTPFSEGGRPYLLRIITDRENRLVEILGKQDPHKVAKLLNDLEIQGEETPQVQGRYKRYDLAWDGRKFIPQR